MKRSLGIRAYPRPRQSLRELAEGHSRPKLFHAGQGRAAPVLLVSGEIDPVTPPWIAAAAARNLPNSRQVLIYYGSHYTYECAENLAAEFIERGTSTGLDTSCLEQVKRLPFNPGK